MLPARPFNQLEIQARLTQILTELEDPEIHSLPLKRRLQILEVNDYAGTLNEIRAGIEAEWQRLLVTARDENSDQNGDNEQERLLFERALLELLPHAHQLTIVEAQLSQLHGNSPSVAPSSIEEGIQALQEERWTDGLFLLSSVVEPPDMLTAKVQRIRRERAGQLLEGLHRQSAQTIKPLNRQERDQTRIIYQQVLRIGTEPQRMEARHFLQPHKAVGWLWAALGLAVLAIIGVVVFNIPALRPTSGTPTSVSQATNQPTVPETFNTPSSSTPINAEIATHAPTASMFADAPTPSPLQPSATTPTTLPTVVTPIAEPPTAISLSTTPTATLMPPLEVRAMQGIKSDYTYTNRVATDGGGPFTRMRAEPNAASTPVGQLHNNDQIAILRSDVADWYQARILTSTDEAQKGVEGWIERWIVDNVNVPQRPTSTPIPPTSAPKPTPTTRSFVAIVKYNNPKNGPSGQQNSCVVGQVVGRGGRAIVGALLYVNNGASTSPLSETNGGGYYRICGLGESNWTIVLTYIPGSRHLAGEAKAVFYVDGTNQSAIVDFNER
jgi:hypothetical protein